MPNYPYISGQGALVAAFTQLRKNVPPKVDASYLKRFNIAPANESYVIAVLRFVGLIDQDGDRVENSTGFLYGDDASFMAGLEAALRSAYADLFGEMGIEALDADKAALAHWFRSSDKTSELVGNRQASTFLTMAALAGHGELPVRASATRKGPTNTTGPARKGGAVKAVAQGKGRQSDEIHDGFEHGERRTRKDDDQPPRNDQGVGLSVKIEVNLPSGGDADTYDAIFASIKKHLMS